jgi:Ni/Co efflux regulator RcnB
MKKILSALVALTFVLGAVAVTYYPTDVAAGAHEKKKDEKKKDEKKDEKKK